MKKTIGLMLSAMLTATGCVEPDTSTNDITREHLEQFSNAEGELFGDIVSATSNDYFVELRPWSEVDNDWVKAPHSWKMWADTSRHMTAQGARNWMFEWIDPADGGLCGELTTYSDSMNRQLEVHKESANHVPSGKEKHCIRPGRYRLLVYKGLLEQELKKEIVIDYLATATSGGAAITVQDSTSGLVQFIQSPTFTGGVHDFVVNIDVQPGNYPPTVVLDLENAGNNIFKTTFANQTTLSGNSEDYFRASLLRTSTNWNKVARGKYLARLYWDTIRGAESATHYYNVNSGQNNNGILRTMQYGDTVRQSRVVTVGAAVLVPDDPVSNTILAARNINYTDTNVNAPVADLTLQTVSTWQNTDQYLTTGRSERGSHIRYSWSSDGGSTWTAETSDTLYDFSGHSSTGSNVVTLKVRDINSGLSSQKSHGISVSQGLVEISGPTAIRTKTTYYYTSNITAEWFERFNPQILWTRATAAGFPEDTFPRIWPAGEYTVEVRQQDSTDALVKRGRKSVTVCTISQSCGLELASVEQSTAAEQDGLFGAGPIVSWGATGQRNAVNLYDLMGLHSGAAFRDKSWLESSQGASTFPSGGGLTWNKRNLDIAGVRAYEFEVHANGVQHVFGFAFDPDLGDPGDDQSGYDKQSGMAYALDGQAVLGILVLSATQRLPFAVWQFGTGRFSPSDSHAVWQAQRTPGVHLLAGKSDVQFVVSSAAQAGISGYTVVIVTGRSLNEARQRALLARELLEF